MKHIVKTLLKQVTTPIFILCLLVSGLLGMAPEAQALFGFSPKLYKSGYTYGHGIYFAPYEFKLYAEPDFSAEVLEAFQWQPSSQSYSVLSTLRNTPVAANHVFVSYFPTQDVAMLAVVGDNGAGWVKVIYDQAAKKEGWVPLTPDTSVSSSSDVTNNARQPMPEHFGKFQTWLDFMKYNTKAHGIYWLSGVSEYQRSVRTADKDEAAFLPLTIIRDLKVRHIRGNWLLVEVLDFERNTPIGWVRWRDDDGNLMIFPNFTGERTPIITTAR